MNIEMECSRAIKGGTRDGCLIISPEDNVMKVDLEHGSEQCMNLSSLSTRVALNQ
jgi:hypothetical protein